MLTLWGSTTFSPHWQINTFYHCSTQLLTSPPRLGVRKRTNLPSNILRVYDVIRGRINLTGRQAIPMWYPNKGISNKVASAAVGMPNHHYSVLHWKWHLKWLQWCRPGRGLSETLYHRDDALLYIAYVMLIWAAPIPADRWHCSLWP